MTLSKKFIAAGYCILSALKWFSARADFQTEESPVIIAKFYPTLRNTFYGSDLCITQYKQQYVWYREHIYVDLFNTYGFVWWYDALICIWWLAIVLLGIYLLIKLFQVIYKCRFPRQNL